MLPKSVVMFTSVAGRFGNSGQTDYAAANDALSKIAASLQSEYPTSNAFPSIGARGER